MTALWIIVAVLVLVAVALVVSYNRFVSQRNLVAESWRQIDVELHRRHDLIPNLVETVKGYAAHERGVFEAVTEKNPINPFILIPEFGTILRQRGYQLVEQDPSSGLRLWRD